MARLRLTVGKITVSTEKETGKLVLPVGLLNMSIYEMSLVNFSFKKYVDLRDESCELQFQEENVPADRGVGRLAYLQ